MSMNFYALRLAPADVAAIKRDPDAATAMTASATASASPAGAGVVVPFGRPAGTPNLLRNYELLQEAGGIGRLVSPFLRRELERQLAQAAALRSAAPEADSARLLDLHKSWHVLHYLFTGDADAGRPPADALLGGREVGDDMGYGPPRLHEAAATSAFARFLGPLTADELKRRIDLGRMRALGIYCCDDDDEGGREELDGGVEHYFPQLRSFVSAAAEAGNGMLMWLS